MSNLSLGKKILESRKIKGMNIRDFAKLTGLSTSLLSQIERGLANPSLYSLRSISEALDIPLFTLFVNDIEHESLIMRKKDRKKIHRESSNHIVLDMLTPDYMKSNVDILWAILNANSQTTSGYREHNKEEFAIIMKGSAYVFLDDKEYLLNEGDTVRILPRMKHKFINKTDEQVEILFILTSSLL